MNRRTRKLSALSEEQKITAKLMEIRIKLEDYVYKNKPISKPEARQYLDQIATYVPKCKNDIRILQVINRCAAQMKRIIEEDNTNEIITINDDKNKELYLETLTKNMSISDSMDPKNYNIQNKLKEKSIETKNNVMYDIDNSPTINLDTVLSDDSISEVHQNLFQNKLKQKPIENEDCNNIDNNTINLHTNFDEGSSIKVLDNNESDNSQSILNDLPTQVEIRNHNNCFREDIDILNDSQYFEETNNSKVSVTDQLINQQPILNRDSLELSDVSYSRMKTNITKQINGLKDSVKKQSKDCDYKKIYENKSTCEFQNSQSILHDYTPSEKNDTFTSKKASIPSTNKFNYNKQIANNTHQNKTLNTISNDNKKYKRKINKNLKTKQTKIISFLTSDKINSDANLNNYGVFKENNNNIALSNTCGSNFNTKKAIKQKRVKKVKSLVDNINEDKNNIKTDLQEACKVQPVTNDWMWIKHIKYIREINDNEYCRNISVPKEFWTDDSLLPGLCEDDFKI